MKDTDQIAAEAADEFCAYHTHLLSKRAQEDLTEAFKSAIEKWDESRRIQLSDYANEILRLQKELSRAAHASEQSEAQDIRNTETPYP